MPLLSRNLLRQSLPLAAALLVLPACANDTSRVPGNTAPSTPDPITSPGGTASPGAVGPTTAPSGGTAPGMTAPGTATDGTMPAPMHTPQGSGAQDGMTPMTPGMDAAGRMGTTTPAPR